MGEGGIGAWMGKLIAGLLFRARPHEFDCGALLDGCIETYEDDPWTRAIHRDAGGDGRGAVFTEKARPRPVSRGPVSAALADALTPAARYAAMVESRESAVSRLLLLSGGGQWGAFGAGFLEVWGPQAEGYDVVTGISTGAIQGLFVANRDWAGLARAYDIAAQSNLAIAKGPLGLLSMGAQFDTAPLRARIVAYLSADGFAKLRGLGEATGPHLLVGMVRARDGALMIVDIRKAVARFYASPAASSPADQGKLAEALAGVVMASASVPGQLRPVRLKLGGSPPATYVDGGVRSSVVAALVGDTADALAAGGGGKVEIEIDVIRNGPTIVPAETVADGHATPVDRKPTVLEIGKRSYAAIVNQVEVGSIALLRLLFPQGKIRVMTADGFNTPSENPDGRPRPPADHVFDPEFMRMLIAWGRRRAGHEGGPRWIALEAIGPPPPPAQPKKD